MLVLSFFVFILAFTTFFRFGNANEVVENELVAVSLLYRHGDRTIQKSYPNDPYKDLSFWPVPYGELINEGKKHHFQLGKWLRNRYNSFLSSQYLASEFLITSSDYDRCLMSASSNLAGLYPPTGDQIWNAEIPWQPIPIHTKPRIEDGMLALDKPCPKKERLHNEVLLSKRVQKFDENFKETYAYLSEHSGKKCETFTDGYDLYDTLLVEQEFNYPLPNWTRPVFPEKLYKAAVMFFSSETFTKQLTKFKVGQYFNEIDTQFAAKINNSVIQKFKVYSAHDNNIYDILKTLLQVDELELVPYTSVVIFELIKKKNEYFVRIFYKKGDEECAKLMEIYGCPSDCPYENFVKILKEYAMDDEQWDKECMLE